MSDQPDAQPEGNAVQVTLTIPLEVARDLGMLQSFMWQAARQLYAGPKQGISGVSLTEAPPLTSPVSTFFEPRRM